MEKDEFTERVLAAEPTLYHVAASLLPQRQDREDAVQNAVLSAWKSLPALREPAHFKTWLVRILLRECYAQLRRSRAAPVELPAEEILYDPHADTARGELREILDALPPKLRVCLVLYYVEGYTVQEIAGILRLPAGTVKSRLARGRDALKPRLDPNEEVTYERA